MSDSINEQYPRPGHGYESGPQEMVVPTVPSGPGPGSINEQRCVHGKTGPHPYWVDDDPFDCPGPPTSTPPAQDEQCRHQQEGSFHDKCPHCLARRLPAAPSGSTEHTDEPDPAVQLAALSKWVDDGNAHRDPEAITWGRIAKVSEECGEAIAAYVGATGQNPRKGVQGCMGDVVKELLDVAVTALAAVEHIRRNSGESITELHEHIDWLCQRVGIEAGRG